MPAQSAQPRHGRRTAGTAGAALTFGRRLTSLGEPVAADGLGDDLLAETRDHRPAALDVASRTAGNCNDAAWLSLLSQTSVIQIASGSFGSRATT